MNARKIFVLLTMIIATVLSVEAQSTGSCPSDALNDTLLLHDPLFKRSFQYMERMLAIQHELDASERTDDIYTLPVVVHVIHNGEPYGTGTNITDEQIFSAIEALNEDYRHLPGTNGDGTGPDVGIDFCLASRDLNGQPTTGIVRVNGSSVPLYSTQGIEASGGNGAIEASVKALSTWPRASYLNIWVVNEIENNDGGSGIQGYAYFPINNPIDGIVILFNAFGTVGNLKSYTNMNRTLTHEVGHYLGLYHTFNGTSSCTGETDCTTQGDRVCDTPVTIQSTSCTNPACSATQQVENYMDYTSQTCQDMFSEGQKLRMRTTLETQRASMITSMGCMPVFTNDVGITAMLSPTGTICQGATNPEVTLANFGSATLTTVTINYNIDGSGSSTYTWNGTLASGASTTVTLGSINPTTGPHTLYAWTSNPNGASDQNSANNQSIGDFTISTGSPLSLDVVLDYYGTETSWVINDVNGYSLMNGGPYVNGQQGLHNLTPVCLAEGCYTLVMNDAYGDGQGFTSGSFSLTSGSGTVLASGAGNWGETSSNDFCVVDTPPNGNAPIASFNIQDNSICKNIANDYTSTSTNTPTSYSWTFEGGSPSTSSSQNPQNITYAASGTYDVTLTATNQYGSHTYTCSNCVTVFADPVVSVTGTNPLCSTSSNGSFTSTVSGTSPYSYSWSNGMTTANISNLSAGTYTVTVTDANTCTKQAFGTITAPSAISITGSAASATCSGMNNGSVSVSASGGTGTKTFTWSNGGTGATISNLAAGSYTVTATDANACTAAQSYTVSAASSMTITGTNTAPTCAGSANGSITVNATGGTGNKTYTWNNGSTGNNISNIAAGTYTVTVSDANGCTQSQPFTLTAPAAISISGTPTNPGCGGMTNGSISVSATGGTGNKTFTWSNGASGAAISNLGAGSYTVTATDANGCAQNQTFTLAAPSGITVTGTTTHMTCSNQSNGSIAVNATGGTGTISYTWSNGASGVNLTGLSAGTYTVTAADNNGCTDSETFAITAPAAMTVAANITNLTCNGSANGGISIAVSGGTGNKTYTWNNGSSSATLNGLNAGNYSVIVTDASGCIASQNYVVTAPAILVANLTDFDIACSDISGSASVNPTGGTAPYAIAWSNGSAGNNAGTLNVGSYSVGITDAQGCATTNNFDITQSANLSVFISASDISCQGSADGALSIMVSGGDENYTYNWSNGSTNPSIQNLTADNYSVTVTDGNGCEGFAQSDIIEPAAIYLELDADDVSCYGLNDGIATCSASGGTEPYFYNWSNGSAESNLNDLNPGEYTVTMTDANGCIAQGIVTIEEPFMLMANVVILSSESCSGNDGSAVVSIEGGTPGYFTLWSDGTNENQISEAAAGNYALVITDAHGCLLNMDVEIPYDCEVVVPSTQLVSSDCNAVNVGQNNLISCDEVTGASMYQWRFTTPTGIILSDEYSLGNVFYVSQIPNLEQGMTYVIGVKALVESNWGPFGQFCSITIEEPEVTEPPGLTDDACGSTIMSWGDALVATELLNVLNYQWHFTGNNYDWLTYTTTNSIVIDENMQFQSGETYSVQMRCAIGQGEFTAWGPICEFTIALDIQVAENLAPPGFLKIYPNPCDGETLLFDFTNLREGISIEDFTLYSPSGAMIEKFNFSLSSESNSIYQHHFLNKLASGIYVLAFRMDGQDNELKLLVR